MANENLSPNNRNTTIKPEIFKDITPTSIPNNTGDQNKDDFQKITFDWNNTKSDYPKNKTIHELFEEQVNKTPNN